MSTGEQAQAAAPAAAAAEAKEVSLLDQVLSATKQTERNRAEELVKTLVDQALAGVVSFDKNVTKTIKAGIKAIDEALSTAARRHHAPSRLPEAGRDLAGTALPGNEQRDQLDAQDQGAERPQARARPTTSTRPSSSIRADLQEAVRERVRDAGRRAVRRPDRRLRVHQPSR